MTVGPLAAALGFLALSLGSVQGLAAQRGFEVLHYDAQLDPDVGAGRLAGRERIVLRAAAEVANVAFDAGDLQIEAVQVDGAPASFTRSGQRLQVPLPAHTAGAEQVLDIRYHGAPKFGLQFVPGLEQAYTVFHQPVDGGPRRSFRSRHAGSLGGRAGRVGRRRPWSCHAHAHG